MVIYRAKSVVSRFEFVYENKQICVKHETKGLFQLNEFETGNLWGSRIRELRVREGQGSTSPSAIRAIREFVVLS